MINFIVRRFVHALFLLLLISIVVFVVIDLPPCDYLTSRAAELERQGSHNAELQLRGLRERYGLDRPLYVRYWLWASNFVQGDFGESFEYQRPVKDLIGDSLLLTVVMSVLTLAMSWVIAIPIGVYSATHKYSLLDQLFTGFSFVGLAIPGFLLALILMVISVYVFGVPIGGLFSAGMDKQAWGIPKVLDLLKHIWIPVVLVGLSGTAELIRIMRGNLLDILNQQYVQSAHARGLRARIVTWKHGVRMAINPLISLIGLQLPSILSGSIIISIVLSLPTTGPLLYRALRVQDMYFAGSFLMLLSMMLLIGNFLADIALAWADPRITYQ
jgi:peptide/nickel transport system permease protein